MIYRTRELPDLASIVSAAATKLAQNDDFIVAEQAARTLVLGLDIREHKQKPLPKFYELSVTGARAAEDFEMAPGYGVGTRPVWSEDPWSWTASLKFPFRMVARATDFGLEILRRRCAEFMRLEGGRAAFGPEVEDRIRRRLARLELKFAYWRPMPRAATRAFGKMLKELADSNVIDPSVFPVVLSEIGGPSLADYQIKIETQPEWVTIGPIPRRQHGGIDHDAWLKVAQDLLFVPTPPGMLALADVTLVRVRTWREVFTSVRICLPQNLMFNEVDETLWGLPQLASIDELWPMYDKKDSKIVCTVADRAFGDLKDSTLTVCPYVMRALSWRRTNNPLKIVDEAGEVMATTIRWQNGTDSMDWTDKEIYAEGQALLFTRKGCQALMRINQLEIIRRRVIQRVEREEGPPIEEIVDCGI